MDESTAPALPRDLIETRSSRELLKWSIAVLKRANIAEPGYESRQLMAHSLGVKPGLVQLAALSLDAAQMQAFAELIARRIAGEPFQYLTGETGFRRGVFWCRPGVLIPRPETETLVERVAMHLLLAQQEHLRVLELGTGSGAPIIALAMDFPHHTYVATDIDEIALALARDNAERNGVAHRVAFLQGDWLDALRLHRVNIPFDIILANPPYIASQEIQQLPVEIREHEPHGALDGGPDGLTFYRRLLGELPTYLKPGGWCLVEIGDGEARPVQAMFERSGLVQVEVTSDLHSLPRVVEGRSLLPGEEMLGD